MSSPGRDALTLTGDPLRQDVRHLTAGRQNSHAHVVDNEHLRNKKHKNRRITARLDLKQNTLRLTTQTQSQLPSSRHLS